jgi:hypothetical protein
LNESNNKNNAPIRPSTKRIFSCVLSFGQQHLGLFAGSKYVRKHHSVSLSVGPYAMRFEKCAQNGRSSGCALSRCVSISASLIPVHDVLYVSELGQEIFSQNLKNCCVVCVSLKSVCVERREKKHTGPGPLSSCSLLVSFSS